MIRLALVLFAFAAPAAAGLTRAELAQVRADPPEGATIDLGTARPTVLIFADYDCGALCDAILARTAAALAGTDLALGPDYALVIVGIDPRDGPDAARAFVAGQAAPLPPERIETRTPDAETLEGLTDDLGYAYRYDEETDRFAHPSARYVLTAEGRVARVLPAFRAEPADLRRALIEASEGEVGTAFERIALACYGFDPVTGRYSLSITRAATLGGIVSTLLVAGGVLIALGRERRAISLRRDRRKETT
ncbi:hypothetical protein ROJ8625_03349 [Roseivivax jejudonensis]|uniref:Thioredoxin domain-containing protein n=1 Tax=Roseivivax jejudonensis TaxID=1529041 RepID=A0A1X6ZYU9_9RHOB|nr:hypothetical protein [Roseivivax jejudonensis]SLN65539.1 hypothetical protein ROJ8625_03349 [Roseivivax jejudonensis]